MNPKEFDQKYVELKDIEKRMSNYNKETPLSSVMEDFEKAKKLNMELSNALQEFQKQVNVNDLENKGGTVERTIQKQ